MRKATMFLSLLFLLVLSLTVGVALAGATPASKDSAMKTRTATKMTAQSSTKTNKSAAEHRNIKNSSANKMVLVLAPAETLSGTIAFVGPSDKEVTLTGSNGVPYDFRLTKKTQVELANKKIGAKELASESHKQATIHFVPTARGNLAESIRISAS